MTSKGQLDLRIDLFNPEDLTTEFVLSRSYPRDMSIHLGKHLCLKHSVSPSSWLDLIG